MAEGGSRSVSASPGSQDLDGDMENSLRRLLGELDSNALRSITHRQLRDRMWEAPDASNRVTTELRLRVMRGIGGSESLVKVTLVHLEMTAYEVAELCQALKPNRVMERLAVSKIPEFGLLQGCEQVAEMLTENGSLKELELRGTGMKSEGFERIANALRHRHAALESLNVSDNEELGDEGARHMAEALPEVALKSLHMSRTGMTRSGVAVLAAALSRNSCLEELNLSNNGLGSAGVTALLEAFREVGPRSDASTGGSSSKNSRSNTKSCCVKKLHVATWESVRGCGRAVADVLQGTSLLTVLNLAGFDLSRREWIQVFESLKDNSTLQTLILKGCSTVGGDSVYYSLMALLDNNTCLRRIELEGTDLHSSGKAEAVREKLRINGQAYVAVLRELDHEKPKSARIFLCGYPYAGKTALRTSMMRAERRLALTAALHSEFLANMCVTFQELLTQQHHYCRRKLIDQDELAQRTRGIEIEVLKDDADDLRVTVWDLAGQEEFHSLQDCMFPDVHSACIFIFVFSAVDHRTQQLKETTALRQELQYWLKFIASTSRRSSAKETPKVIVVVTNRDRAAELRLRNCTTVIKQLGKDFEGFVDVDTSIHSLDATKYQEAEHVLRHAFEKLRVLVTDKQVPKACDQVRLLVQDWISEHPNRPTMSSDDFFSLCKQTKSLKDMADLPPNTMATRRKAVASYLHNVGEIIYFEELDFVVVNPHWFCHGILGRLIKIGASSRPANPSEAGFMSREQLHKLLVQSIPSCTRRPSPDCFQACHPADPLVEVQDLVKLMLKIELCYEIEPGNPQAGFFIPAILDDAITAAAAANGERQLHWPDAGSSSTAFSYLGRRLECDERNRTFLTPGFFPRLQVILRKEYLTRKWSGEYSIQRNLITVSHDGIDILVEHSGSIGYFVDVLVRSRPHKSQEETLRFVQENVVNVIREFCASHMGCQGVSLVEAAIRSECVSGLTVCRHRQAARVETLKELLQRSQQPRFQHSWSVDVAGHLGANMEPVVNLLGPVDAKDALLHRPLRALQSVAAAELVPDPAKDSPGPESLLRRVLAKLDSIGRKFETLDSLQHSVAAIQAMQSDMLRELVPRLDDILGFAVEAKQREFPRLLFLTEPAEGFRRKLIAKLVPGRQVTLNFMCEHRECPHVVPGAPGLKVTVRDQLARDVARFLRPTLKLLSLLVRVAAHVGAGIGNAIPDFSNLPEALGLTLGGLVVEEVAGDVGGDEARDATSTLAESNSLLTLLKGQNIAETFMLHQVRYKRKENREAHIAWICRQHRDEGQRNQTLDDLAPTFHPL